MSSNNLLGKRIERLRIEKGLTQEELGKIFQVKRETVSYWEHGYREIKASQLVELAKFFDVSTDYLLGISDIKDYDVDLKAASKYLGISERATAGLKQEIENITDTYMGMSQEYLKVLEDILSSDVKLFYPLVDSVVQMMMNNDISFLSNIRVLQDNSVVKAIKSNPYKDMTKYYLFEEIMDICNSVLKEKESLFTTEEKETISKCISKKDVENVVSNIKSKVLKEYFEELMFFKYEDIKQMHFKIKDDIEDKG